MKKLFLTAALAVAGIFATEAYAQDRSSIVKINPLSLAVATFNGSFEHAVTDNSALQLGVFYTGVSVGDFEYNGIGITPEYRIYLGGEALEGWHVSPYVRYQNLSFSGTDIDENGNMTDEDMKFNSYGGGVVLGHQWLLGSSDRVSLDLFLGPNYSIVSFKDESNENQEDDLNSSFSGFGLRTGLTFGVAF
jgi:hypothetical protein